MKKNGLDNIIFCPSCGIPIDRTTLYNLECVCPECYNFINVDDYDWGSNKDMYGFEGYESSFLNDSYDDYDYEDDLIYQGYKQKIENKERSKSMKDKNELVVIDNEEDMNEQVASFIIRFMTSSDYETIKESFSVLGADIEYLSLENKGPIRSFVETSSGEKLLTGLKEDKNKLDEYEIIVSIFLDKGNDSKKIFTSTLAEAFPLCIMREEGSGYIMANNKGLAKGLIDSTNEDEIELLSLFLDGFEKYQILCKYLYWIEPYRAKKEEDIFIKWDKDSLVNLEALRRPKSVPVIWQEFLSSIDSVFVSVDDKDSGTEISFEKMLEDVYEDDKKSSDDDFLVQVISLRGIKDYALGSDGEEIDATKK